MTEAELKAFLGESQRAQNEAEIQREKYIKQIVPAILKVPIEGLVSGDDKIAISDDLEIIRVTEEVRDQFFKRAASLELRDYKNENNWFFATYKFEDERRKIGGIETGERILFIAIFFAICSEQKFKINKAQGFAPLENELQSIGITMIPNAPWRYDSKTTFEPKVIDELRSIWPLFRDAFNAKHHFALVARRYYFSLIRNQWEDQIIDLIISLEALLVPEINEINKSGKVSKRLSRLLHKHFQRGEVAKIVEDCYVVRNCVVHGKPIISTIGDVNPLIDCLRHYVKIGLKTYLLDYKNLSANELVEKLEQLGKI